MADSMYTVSKVFALLLISTTLVANQDDELETITFKSEDGLNIAADLYLEHSNKTKPFIVLCHQAGWSRGEYREIAPKLVELGFNCMAIDQRSGKEVNGVSNKTASAAKAEQKGTTFLDAEQDVIAALKHAKDKYAKGKLLLWGSSYSAALALRIAGENPDLIDGVLSFAPGEYFQRFGKSADFVQKSAKKIKIPVFITSAKREYENWRAIFEAVPVDQRTKFLPNTAGNHGSRALWEKFSDHDEYWRATKAFLKKFD